eukprot:384823-Amphidinium_carterae.1
MEEMKAVGHSLSFNAVKEPRAILIARIAKTLKVDDEHYSHANDFKESNVTVPTNRPCGGQGGACTAFCSAPDASGMRSCGLGEDFEADEDLMLHMY